jgi:integrase
MKTPATPSKPRYIITPAQFDLLYQALPDADAQLLVETDIESGMRWGELSEIRVRDLDFATCILIVSRAVSSSLKPLTRASREASAARAREVRVRL